MIKKTGLFARIKTIIPLIVLPIHNWITKVNKKFRKKYTSNNKTENKENIKKKSNEKIGSVKLNKNQLSNDTSLSEDVNKKAGVAKDFKVKGSIVASISLLYLVLTILNLVIFWVATGSNQMRLISNNALLQAQSTAYEVLRRIQPLVSEKKNIQKWKSNPKGLAKPLKKSLMLPGKNAGMIISSYLVTRSDNTVLFGVAKKIPPKLNSKEFRSLIQAIKMRDIKGQPYYGVPDISNYKVNIYIPFTQFATKELILSFELPMSSIKKELSSLVRLALIMIVVMVFVQSFFGFYIYKRFIKPIKELTAAAKDVAKGNFTTKLSVSGSNELGFLTHWFNNMTSDLGEMTSKLKNTIQELADRHAELDSHMDMAANIQGDLLPGKLKYPHIKSAIFYDPEEKVSGDYYDFFKLKDGSLGILIADAMGHGVPAAFMTIIAKVYFSNAVKLTNDPGRVLDFVSKNMSKMSLDDSYLTGIYIVVQPDLSMRYARGAHQPGLILRKKDNTIQLMQPEGFLIGVDSGGINYEVEEYKLEQGDRILIFTDGIIEAKNPEGELFNLPRLRQLFLDGAQLSIKDHLQTMVDDMRQHLDGGTPGDDCTVMMFEVEISSEDESMESKAGKAFREGRFEEAKDYYAEWAKMRRSGIKPILGQAYCHVRLGHFKDALDFFAEVQDRDDLDYEANINRGICYYNLNDLDHALESFIKAGECDPGETLPDRWKAILYVKQGEVKKVRQIIQDLLARKMDDVEEYLRLCKFQKRMEKRIEKLNQEDEKKGVS